MKLSKPRQRANRSSQKLRNHHKFVTPRFQHRAMGAPCEARRPQGWALRSVVSNRWRSPSIWD
eukprot:6965558-Alexandrium_andersonii.AAC.1